ncbi:MAG: hypothetical protein IJ265_10105 [Oscillospiraceae bacterium]|nr:hypothetical protein [Oscillospiraceae bacterium]
MKMDEKFMIPQTHIYKSYKCDQQYNGAAILLQPETAPLRCTVVVTTQFSEYTIFLKILRKHDLLDESYSMIEMHHAKRRMTYVQPLNLLVVQIENIERLWYLNIMPEKILLTGTARCFNVKQAPCDTIVTADAVWDKKQNIFYECPYIAKMPITQISAAQIRTGGYFSETDVQEVLRMQKESSNKQHLLAFDEDSVTFAQICSTFDWQWSIIKAVTNDLSIPNPRMRDHAAGLVSEYVIEVLKSHPLS